MNTLKDQITPEDIDRAASLGACEEGIEWARDRPGVTWADLPDDYLAWSCGALPELAEVCPEGLREVALLWADGRGHAECVRLLSRYQPHWPSSESQSDQESHRHVTATASASAIKNQTVFG